MNVTVAPDSLIPADLFAAAGLPAVTRFVVGVDEASLPPSSPAQRVEHNLTVIRLLRDLRKRGASPSEAERRTLARWAGWGAVPELFDESVDRYATRRADLIALLGPSDYAAARRSTINAHYTHPLIVDAVWQFAARLSFTGGRVLEPGCGPGVFIGRAPDGVSVTGVELDPTTAAIAQVLYPQASICSGSFTDTRGLKDASFDLVIGNVPFGDIALYDPVYNQGRHSIHNHFLIKGLALLAPGGLLLALTSRFTLDSQRDAARREMHGLADLLAAVRLPASAHSRVAGTEALTDLVVLRRRPDAQAPASDAWLQSVPVHMDGEEVLVNRHFLEHPAHVLGTFALATGPYCRDLSVQGDTSAVTVSAGIVAVADSLGLPAADAAPVPERSPATPAVLDAEPEPSLDFGELWDGHIVALSGGGFGELVDGSPEPLAVPKNAAAEMRLLLALRDQTSALLTEEAAHVEHPAHLDQLRAELRATYQRYLRTYGPINRYKTHDTGRSDPDTGEAITRRTYPRAVRLLLGDPVGPLVLSLELFDDDTQTAVEADLLRRRVLRDREAITSVDTPQDALAVSYDQLGRVDLDAVAGLLGTSAEQARAGLGELVYTDPETATLVPAAEYLSGHVRSKLDRARAATAADPAFAGNVAALEAVLPTPLGADEIDAKMGAVWISDKVHQRFLAELLEDPHAVVEYGGGNLWEVKARSFGTLATSDWGTRRMPGPEIASALLQQKSVVVRDPVPDTNRYVVNADETAAAQEKGAAMQERFAEWCWEDPERAGDLLREYNTRFNSLVLRDYSRLGETLTLPGLADSFVPNDHQRTAVARIITEPSVGLFHQVGAGKTASMVIAAHELRRLGMVHKPVVVVPNHMLEQFAREWLQLYPLAKILAAGADDLARDNRRKFVARVAANAWDAVIMTRTAFERLPVSPDVENEYLQRELAEIRGQLEDQKSRGARLTVKKLEKMVARAEAALQKRLDNPVDVGLTFESTGIDYLFVDEAHGYKNLATVSNIQGAAIPGSKRASDLHMKLEYLRVAHGERVATFATATPIANSITEAHVMCRYLRPDLLEAAGIKHFDAWAATFGETVTQMEMAVTGGGNYRLNTRFARFQNVPEMLRIWHVFADVKTAEDLDLPTPPLKPRPDGQRLPEPIVIPTPPEVSAYLQDLAARAERVRNRQVEPEEDNMLKISTDGRKAALDMRLVAAGRPIAGTCKVQVAADNIARIFQITRNVAYRIPGSDVRHPTLGALQIVFCDLSTPHPQRWNAYRELRRLLVERGVGAEQVRYAHEARNDAEKARLFEACRSGQVAVLIGSTEKMGVGTNIQARAIALHHLDCPWRPADIEQREGRILRQGNQNSGVRIYRYVVEGSFDAYSWQTVERKARFIGQVMQGRLDVRSIDDIADSTLSFAEVKALAAGDNLILDQANLSAEVTRLQRLQRAHRNNQAALHMTVQSVAGRLAKLDQDIIAIDAALARHVDTRADKFALTLDGSVYTNRTQAGMELVHILEQAPTARARPLGEIGALRLSALVRYNLASGDREAFVSFDGLPATEAYATLPEAREDPLTLIRQIEARANGLEGLRARTVAKRGDAEAEAQRARAAIGAAFKHADALAQASAKLAAVNAELAAKAQAQERQSAEAAVAVAHAQPEPVAVPAVAAASDDIPI